MKKQITTIPWPEVRESMNKKGFALVRGVLTPAECQQLAQRYQDASLYRKTIAMERYRFGLGEYKYFKYPLPSLLAELRTGIYPQLVPVANEWMEQLNSGTRFPMTLEGLLDQCRANKQEQPTLLILKYGKGGHNTLHQDLYGDVWFPMQAVLFLDEPGVDYKGGEFVITQQTPRAQSKATVLQPGKGDMLIFTTNFRPVKGVKGYYRSNMKHGVSELHEGQRHTVGIIFHDALT